MRHPDRTQQHFEKECNINNIMKRYQTTGILIDPSVTARRMPQFGDFRNVKSFMDAQNMLIHAKSVFDGLPAQFRYRFQNDVHKLLAWVEKPENKKEAQKYGFIAPDPVPPVPTDIQKLVEKIDVLVSNNEDIPVLKASSKKDKKPDAAQSPT